MKRLGERDQQTFTSEFESHWVVHSCDLVPHQSKKLSKLKFIHLVSLATIGTRSKVRINRWESNSLGTTLKFIFLVRHFLFKRLQWNFKNSAQTHTHTHTHTHTYIYICVCVCMCVCVSYAVAWGVMATVVCNGRRNSSSSHWSSWLLFP